MSTVAASPSPTVVGAVALAVLAAFGGYTASFTCLVLERRTQGRSPAGRSACACGAAIPMYRNIPVVTWAVQRGRAACCGGRIPAWYAVAETGTAAAPVVGALTLPAQPVVGAAAGTILAVVVTVIWNGYSQRRHRLAAEPVGSSV